MLLELFVKILKNHGFEPRAGAGAGVGAGAGAGGDRVVVVRRAPLPGGLEVHEDLPVALGERLALPVPGDVDRLADLHRVLGDVHTQQADLAVEHGVDRVPDAIRLAASDQLLSVIDTPTTGRGRLDLLWRHSEQSISHVYHRYGNLAGRTPGVEPT